MEQILRGNRSIIGLMLESHLLRGQAEDSPAVGELRYGVSITDGCIDWTTTEALLLEIADAVRPVLGRRVA